MRVVLASLIVLVVAGNAVAQGSDWQYAEPNPGDLVLGYHQTWYWPPSIYMCPTDEGTMLGHFSVWGIAPEFPVTGVRFNVVSAASLYPVGVVLEGAVDVAGSGESEWDLEFGSCLQWPAGTPVELVHYRVLTMPGLPEPLWICLSGPDNIQVEWTTCSGETIVGGIYPPDDFAYPAGCFSADPYYCVVEADASSWTSLKAQF